MSARKLRPTGNRVLVEPLPAAEKSSGGILLSVAYQQPNTQGIIVAIGGTVQELKVGNWVAYNWINGIEVEHDGKTVSLLPADAVLAVLGYDNAFERFHHVNEKGERT
jgi:chaperonin GroES